MYERTIRIASSVALNCKWWRHQMEIFSALQAICTGIHRSPVNSQHQGHWRGALMFSLICVRINDWANNRGAGDLRRHRAHYGVIGMNGKPRYFTGIVMSSLQNRNNIFTFTQHRYFKPSLLKDNDTFIQLRQYRCCWWPGNIRINASLAKELA